MQAACTAVLATRQVPPPPHLGLTELWHKSDTYIAKLSRRLAFAREQEKSTPSPTPGNKAQPAVSVNPDIKTAAKPPSQQQLLPAPRPALLKKPAATKLAALNSGECADVYNTSSNGQRLVDEDKDDPLYEFTPEQLNNPFKEISVWTPPADAYKRARLLKELFGTENSSE